MTNIFIGVKVKVIKGKYKGKTARVYSYTQNSCTLISDGDSTTIQEIRRRRLHLPHIIPTGNIKRKHIVVMSPRTPPSLYFLISYNRLFHMELLKYCNKKFPKYLAAFLQGLDLEQHDIDVYLEALRADRQKVPVYNKFFAADMRESGWRAEFWSLYCDAFYDSTPDAVKIQSIIRMYLQRKDYFEILSLKPGGIGYLKAKMEFDLLK